MNNLNKNIVANIASSSVISGLQFVTVPIYLYFLGAEVWGLLSALLVVFGVFRFLDLGMSQVLPREIATRFSNGEITPARRILVAFEIIYTSTAVIGFIVIYISSSYIATRWLKLDGITGNEASLSLKLLSLQFLFQWPISCYQAGLVGIQRQVLLANIQIIFAIFKYIGAALALYFISPTLIVYQITFICVIAAELLVTRSTVWRVLGGRIRLSSKVIAEAKSIMKFSFGAAGTVLVGVLVLQIDKLILSGIVPIAEFGYYTIASSLSVALLQLVYPFSKAIYPHIVSLIALNKNPAKENMRHLYFVSLFLMPVCLTVSVFSSEILMLWTHNDDVAKAASLPLSLLVIGTLLNGYYNVAYTNWFAYGVVKMPLYINIFSLIFALVTVPIFTAHFGISGASLAWLSVNFIGCIFGISGLVAKRLVDVRALVIHMSLAALIVFILIFIHKFFLSVLAIGVSYAISALLVFTFRRHLEMQISEESAF